MVFNSVYEMRICKICSSDTTLVDKTKGECWFKYDDGVICNKCYRKNQYFKNKETINKSHREWYQRNKVKRNKKIAEWQSKNKDKMNSYTRKYRKEHSERYFKSHYKSLNNALDVIKELYDNPKTIWDFKHCLAHWSKAVRERNDNKCMECNNDAEISHHILPKKQYPEFSLLLSNGMALCKPCHVKIHREMKQYDI